MYQVDRFLEEIHRRCVFVAIVSNKIRDISKLASTLTTNILLFLDSCFRSQAKPISQLRHVSQFSRRNNKRSLPSCLIQPFERGISIPNTVHLYEILCSHDSKVHFSAKVSVVKSCCFFLVTIKQIK